MWGESVVGGRRGERRALGVFREAGFAGEVYYRWRDKLLEGGKEGFAGTQVRHRQRALRRKVAELERVLSRKTYELGIAGKALAGWE